ncbi:MAG: glycerate kinase [Synergistaceae bacterium]|nr:glycerate kinase [Synergistaceae bacterium]
MFEGFRAIEFPGGPEDAGLGRLYRDANEIIVSSITANMPEEAVKNALAGRNFQRKACLIAIGKAAWSMARAAFDGLGGRVGSGIVITKYGHSGGPIGDFEIFEAGHPITDENSVAATERAIGLASGLGESDELIFLVSGGGSALFEKPLPGVTLGDIARLSAKLLESGADISEVNTVRKRLSAVKAGRFAEICGLARVFSVVLSDVIGDRLDIIASGPAAPDLTTARDAWGVVERYGIPVPEAIGKCLDLATPKETPNVTSVVTGSVRTLCGAAEGAARSLGYEPFVLSTEMNCEAAEAGRLIASVARAVKSGDSSIKPPCAVIFGGETVVRVRGGGVGGRNQELALAASVGIDGLDGTVIFSFGSDGTDGPTDAAGGIVDGRVAGELRELGLDPRRFLENNDSHAALKKLRRLVVTGPTGTNVNDISVILSS